MAKNKTRFVCQNCEAVYLKWQGQCSACKQWNTLIEEEVEPKSSAKFQKKELSASKLKELVVSLPDVNLSRSSKQRFSSGIGELDRVLGGGIVPGAVMLLGGEPGIGKSTLLTQACLIIGAEARSLFMDKSKKNKSGKTNKKNKSKKSAQSLSKTKTQKVQNVQKYFSSINRTRILFICGEESPEQISLRIKRILNNEQFLSMNDLGHDKLRLISQIEQNLQFVTSVDVDEVVSIINQTKPGLVVVDSIQALSTSDLTGGSGSIGQIRESTERLIRVAKRSSIPIFLVGHVTKEGVIAGPKVLEHMVDAVLQLEGERIGQFRMLRALKNRFGATDEVGVFKVVEYGYQPVANPSELFVENQDTKVAGSAITCVMEGTRPLLLEVQALVNQSQLAMPRRVGRGIELSRIQILAAVMQKHAKQPLGNYDIFLSAAGGFKVREPATDLALSVAIASSLSNQPIKTQAVFIGEVGLLGEIRTVAHLERRVKEAKRLGYKKVVTAKTHRKLSEVLKEFGI
jgi:DNA repair protein RadA/Sms